MDFTREPIIETVITPKEGCKLVVRSSKALNQEEYFVDAVEVVSFGKALFFRSLEKPKSFLVPVSDYEILEVREARMILKHVGSDRTIKIGGGREGAVRSRRESGEGSEIAPAEEAAIPEEAAQTEEREKRRDKRRHTRRRRGREEREGGQKEGEWTKEGIEPSTRDLEKEESGIVPPEKKLIPPFEGGSRLLPPPPKLISETIALYKEKEEFKKAFYTPPGEEGQEEPRQSEGSFSEGVKSPQQDLASSDDSQDTLKKDILKNEQNTDDSDTEDLWNFSQGFPTGNQDKDPF